MNWDEYGMSFAVAAAKKSKDPSSQVGAAIMRPDGSIASTGFNGFPKGMPDLPELYGHRAFKMACVLHAEDNAITFARDPSLEGCTIYVSGLPPCAHCASKIMQVRIKRVVSSLPYGSEPERWHENMTWAHENLRAAGIACDVVQP